jgi:hypothetical protein
MNIVQYNGSFEEIVQVSLRTTAWLNEHLGERTAFTSMHELDHFPTPKDTWLSLVADFEKLAGPTDPSHRLSSMVQSIGPGYEWWVVVRYILVTSAGNGKIDNSYYSRIGEAVVMAAFDDVTTAVQFKLSMS